MSKLSRKLQTPWSPQVLADAGYQYVVIDDGWSLRERDGNKRLVPDPEKFPSGMKALSDYIHSKGLKFGIHSCAGVKTCAGYPGSFEHEFIDAETFAEWGVDFLNMTTATNLWDMDGRLLYRRMAMALKLRPGDPVQRLHWGIDDSHLWMRSAGAHMWRSTYDILDSWESIKKLALQKLGKECYSGPYSYNDVDMPRRWYAQQRKCGLGRLHRRRVQDSLLIVVYDELAFDDWL